jgi:hypothetical protein
MEKEKKLFNIFLIIISKKINKNYMDMMSRICPVLILKIRNTRHGTRDTGRPKTRDFTGHGTGHIPDVHNSSRRKYSSKYIF